MLKHAYTTRVNAPINYCRKCILNPQEFLQYSNYTYVIRQMGDKYEVVFQWRKWGVTRYYKVVFEVKIEDDTIIFEPTSDSPYYFRMVFKLEKEDDETIIYISSEMEPGIFASLLGRKDYAKFIKELVEKGIVGMARKLAKERKESEDSRGVMVAVRTDNTCKTCILFDTSRNYCYALSEKVGDPQKPPCNGRFYIARRIAIG